MSSRALWLRWSWRDLRARWAQVCALAAEIALGTGSYAVLHTHDRRVALAQGSTVRQGSLLGLLRRLPHAADVTGARERLIVPTQVAGPKGVLGPGELVGTGSGPGPAVDAVQISAGQNLPKAADGSAPAVILDRGFARQNDLPDRGMLRAAGGAH